METLHLLAALGEVRKCTHHWNSSPQICWRIRRMRSSIEIRYKEKL